MKEKKIIIFYYKIYIVLRCKGMVEELSVPDILDEFSSAVNISSFIDLRAELPLLGIECNLVNCLLMPKMIEIINN